MLQETFAGNRRLGLRRIVRGVLAVQRSQLEYFWFWILSYRFYSQPPPVWQEISTSARELTSAY